MIQYPSEYVSNAFPSEGWEKNSSYFLLPSVSPTVGNLSEAKQANLFRLQLVRLCLCSKVKLGREGKWTKPSAFGSIDSKKMQNSSRDLCAESHGRSRIRDAFNNWTENTERNRLPWSDPWNSISLVFPHPTLRWPYMPDTAICIWMLYIYVGIMVYQHGWLECSPPPPKKLSLGTI